LRPSNPPNMNALTRLFVNRNFALMWSGQAFSSFGEYVFASTVTVWLILDLARNSPQLPTLIAAVVLVSAVPRLLVAPFAGTFVDRWPVRRTMILSDLLRVVLFVPVLVSVAMSAPVWLEIFEVLILLFLVSACAQFFNAARAAAMQVVIPAERRVGASSFSLFASMGVAIVATMSGPALFAAVGPFPAAAANVVTYGLSAVSVLLTSRQLKVPRGAAQEARYWHEFRRGFSTAWSSRPIRLILFGVALYGFSLGVNNSVLSLFALKTAHLTAAQYGLVASMFSVGGLVGVIAVPWVFKRVPIQRAFIVCIASMGVIYAGYALGRSALLLAILMFLAGVAFSGFVTAQGPILQEATPVGYMGRITSVSAPMLAITSLIATVVTSLLISGQASFTSANSTPDASSYSVAIFAAALLMVAGGIVLWAIENRQRHRSQRTDDASSYAPS
jgi:MFS family permease